MVQVPERPIERAVVARPVVDPGELAISWFRCPSWR